ncbi:uncharacterized protein VTP21DRAFT_9406 [Calcarisporiella thermophila]|uniref:uncharacterized protein n=1 Tax=Calcarisporiella thermophila TaxID=911321 RepID=UPI0037424F0E
MSSYQDNRVILPGNVRPKHYEIHLKADLEKFTFQGEENVLIEVKEDTASITVNSIGLEIEHASVGASKEQRQEVESIIQDLDKHQVTFKLRTPLAANTTAYLYVRFNGNINTKMHGFYRSSYLDANREKKFMGVTQLCATDARRVFPCWDEPALKATFELKLTVASNLSTVSNMPISSEHSLDNQWKEVKFERTPIMSTYLLAFVIGELEYIEEFTPTLRNSKNNPIPVRVYTPPGLKNQGFLSLHTAIRSLELFTQKFGQPYPLPKLDLIAIPDFEVGAMENWGCITFRLATILYDEEHSELKAKQRVAYVTAHECAHQWFGNLVTAEWWSDIWLNEGFATWVGWFAINKFFPEWNVWVQFLEEELRKGMLLDALRSSHPIELTVNKAEEILQIFDQISYSKGASVIRMLANWMGEEVFLSGIRDYLAEHAYGSANTQDLWRALSNKSGADVGKFMDLWTKQIGHPVLTVTQPTPNKIHVKQNRFLSTGDVQPSDDHNLWWVPLRVHLSNKEMLNMILSEREETFDLGRELSSDDFFKLNHQHTGVYRVDYTPEHLARLAEAARQGLLEAGDRTGLLSDTGALVMSGYTRTSTLLHLMQGYENEEDNVVVQELCTHIDAITNTFSEQPTNIQEGLREYQRRLFSKLVRKLGWEYPEQEDYRIVRLRTLVIRQAGLAGDKDVLQEAQRRFQLFLQGDSSALHPNIRSVAYDIVVAYGGEAELEAVTKLYLETEVVDQKLAALRALGQTRDPVLVQRVLSFNLSEAVRNQDFWQMQLTLASNPVARRPHLSFILSNWPEIQSRFAGALRTLGIIVKLAVSSFADEEIVREVEAFFADKDVSEFDMQLKQALEDVRVQAKWAQRDGGENGDVAKWLHENGFF